MLGNFVMLLLTLLTFQKKSFRNTIRVTNSLDADQDQRSVGTDLAPNCWQRLSAEDKKFTEMYSLLGNAVSSVNTMRTLFLLGLPACFPVAGADAGSMVYILNSLPSSETKQNMQITQV